MEFSRPQTVVGSLSIPLGIFSTQESNLSLLHCRQILYQLSYQGKPLLSSYCWLIPRHFSFNPPNNLWRSGSSILQSRETGEVKCGPESEHRAASLGSTLSLSYNAFQEADLISLAVVIKDLISFPSPTPTFMVLLAEIIRELNYSQWINPSFL